MNKVIKPIGWILIKLLIALIIIAIPVFGLINPASSYCTLLGYQYIGEKCKVSDNIEVDAWEFLKGEAAQEHSFCAQEGYEIKTIKDKARCAIYGTEECAVCVIGGKETDVAEAMNINFEETFCGDKNCGLPETSQTCPEDCPKGGFDMYCDEGVDDPDCVEPLTEEMILKEYEIKRKVEAEREEKIKKEKSQKALIKKIAAYSIGGVILVILLFIVIRYLKQKNQKIIKKTKKTK